jgi:hypothetical protein
MQVILFGQVRSTGLDDDGDLIVVAVNKPVEGHGPSLCRLGS